MTAELDGATIEISFFRRVAASEVPTNFDKITGDNYEDIKKKIFNKATEFGINDNLIKQVLDSLNTEKILLPSFMLFLMLFDSYMFIFSITLFYIFMYKIFTQLKFK